MAQLQFLGTVTNGSNVVTATADPNVPGSTTRDLSTVTAGTSTFVASVIGNAFPIGINGVVAPVSGNGNRWQLQLAAPWAGATASNVACASHVAFNADGSAILDYRDAAAIALINGNTAQQSGINTQQSAATQTALANASQALANTSGPDQTITRDLTVGHNLAVNGAISGPTVTALNNSIAAGPATQAFKAHSGGQQAMPNNAEALVNFTAQNYLIGPCQFQNNSSFVPSLRPGYTATPMARINVAVDVSFGGAGQEAYLGLYNKGVLVKSDYCKASQAGIVVMKINDDFPYAAGDYFQVKMQTNPNLFVTTNGGLSFFSGTVIF